MRVIYAYDDMMQTLSHVYESVNMYVVTRMHVCRHTYACDVSHVCHTHTCDDIHAYV